MADTNIPPPEERFKTNLVSLSKIIANELSKARKKGIKTVSENIVILGINLVNGSVPETLIEGFIRRSFPTDNNGKTINYWDEAYSRNQSFFLEKSYVIFGDLPEGIIKGLKTLIETHEASEKLMLAIWNHLGAMIKNSIHYIYLKREPIRHINKHGYQIDYQKSFFDQVVLEDEASRWKINLDDTSLVRIK